MDYIISISEAAENDIIQAFTWYEEQKNDLGFLFEKYLNQTISRIQRNPFTIQNRYNQIKVAFLKKFPYGVHFDVNGNEIIIIAVFHTSQNPKKWLNR